MTSTCTTCAGTGQYPAASDPFPCMDCGGTRDICWDAMMHFREQAHDLRRELYRLKVEVNTLRLGMGPLVRHWKVIRELNKSNPTSVPVGAAYVEGHFLDQMVEAYDLRFSQ